MDASPPPSPLAGWTVLCLRPAAELRTLRRQLSAEGARLHCLAPWHIVALPVGDKLQAALRAPLLVATSPNAVRLAARLAPLRDYRGHVVAVGSGTAAALQRAGLRRVETPAQMHSEGVLALPSLAAPGEVALLTGEGGRNLIGEALQARGARLQRVDLYRRAPRQIPAAAIAAVTRITPPATLFVSSEEALRGAAALPALRAALQRLQPVYASSRLHQSGLACGLADGPIAASARPADLLAALRAHAKAAAFR